MRKLSNLIVAATILTIGVMVALSPVSVDALTGGMNGGANSARGADQPSDLFGTTGLFTTITNVMLYVIGAVSVIMIIIGGLRYVLSGGDSGNITTAKNTILYAIVGIIVALMAYAIVNFVIGSFVDGGSVTGSGGSSATNF